MIRSTRWMLLLLTALPLSASAEPDGPVAPDLPEPLKPFVPFVEQCRQWHNRDRGLEWQTVYDEKFDQGPEQWRQASRYAQTRTEAGKNELLITPPYGATAFVPIGPQINGQFAIEMVGRAVGDKTVPLSIMLGMERGQGPGFQFATRRDGQHLIWTDTLESSDGAFGPKSLGNEPKLNLNQSYRIRLEVCKSGITTYVDGKLFGKAELSNRYDWNRQQQPTAMTVVAPIAVTSYRIEKFVPSQGEKQTEADVVTWQKVFGDRTREQVEAEAGELVQMLDHDKWAVREAAAGLIRDVREFALPALRKGVANGPPELKWRAEGLLKFITPPAQPTDPQPSQAGQTVADPGLILVPGIPGGVIRRH